MTKNIHIHLCIFTFASVLFPACLFAASSDGYVTGFQFLEEPVNPRLIAMGSAGTAMPSTGFFYYNPAQPFLSAGQYLHGEYGQENSDVNKALFETDWTFPHWFIAASIPTFRIPDIIPADEKSPNYDAPFSSQQTSLSLDGGYFQDRYGFALCVNGTQDRTFTYTSYALSLSAGLACWIVPGKLSAGAAAFHPNKAGPVSLALTKGSTGETDAWGKGAALPGSERLGCAWQDTFTTISYAAALDIVYGNTNGTVTMPVGIEVWPVKPLAIRMGCRLFHDTEKFNCGIGLRFAPIMFDASFVITSYGDDTGLKWLLGLTYSL
jgi:hypothetical protein